MGRMEHIYYIGSSAPAGALTGASKTDVGPRVAIRALLGYPSFDRDQRGKPTAYSLQVDIN